MGNRVGRDGFGSVNSSRSAQPSAVEGVSINRLAGFRCAQGGGNPVMEGREAADGIGGARIAGNHERLASASAEIDRAVRAAPARFLHPVLSAKGVERGGVAPYFLERAVADAVEAQAHNHGGGVTREHESRGGYADITARPSAH